MNKEAVLGMYDYLGMVHHTTLNVIGAFPEDQLDWAPREGMRTPRDLIEHIYGQATAKLAAARRGTMSVADLMAHHNSPRPGSQAELLDWCRERFDTVRRELAELTDEQWNGSVEAFFGTFPTPVFLSITYDEWWHHRGQLTIYLRLLGIDVPNIYDYPAA